MPEHSSLHGRLGEMVEDAKRCSDDIERRELSPPGTLTDNHTLRNSSRGIERTCLLEKGGRGKRGGEVRRDNEGILRAGARGGSLTTPVDAR